MFATAWALMALDAFVLAFRLLRGLDCCCGGVLLDLLMVLSLDLVVTELLFFSVDLFDFSLLLAFADLLFSVVLLLRGVSLSVSCWWSLVFVFAFSS